MDTKQQLDSVQRYKAGYYSDEWGVRGSTPTCIPAHDGAWVRFADMQALQAGYDAAQLEIESLKARVQELGQLESALARHERSGKDWAMRAEALERTITTLRDQITTLRAQIAPHDAKLTAAEKAMRGLESANSIALQLDARIKELEGQLDAVGAGGVEPLRKRDCLHQITEPDHFRGATEMVQASAPVVLPAPDVFAKVSHKGAAKWDVEFTWPVGRLEEDGDHKLYTEQQVRAMLAAAPKTPACSASSPATSARPSAQSPPGVCPSCKTP